MQSRLGKGKGLCHEIGRQPAPVVIGATRSGKRVAEAPLDPGRTYVEFGLVSNGGTRQAPARCAKWRGLPGMPPSISGQGLGDEAQSRLATGVGESSSRERLSPGNGGA